MPWGGEHLAHNHAALVDPPFNLDGSKGIHHQFESRTLNNPIFLQFRQFSVQSSAFSKFAKVLLIKVHILRL